MPLVAGLQWEQMRQENHRKTALKNNLKNKGTKLCTLDSVSAAVGDIMNDELISKGMPSSSRAGKGGTAGWASSITYW